MQFVGFGTCSSEIGENRKGKPLELIRAYGSKSIYESQAHLSNGIAGSPVNRFLDVLQSHESIYHTAAVG